MRNPARLGPVSLLVLLLSLPGSALIVDNGLAPPNPDNVITDNPVGDMNLAVPDGGCGLSFICE